MFQSPNSNSRHVKILPVIDLHGGEVVRAVGGQRSVYRPLVSRLTPSTEPVAVANAIQEQFGWEEFYVADLDAIGGGDRSYDVYDRLHQAGFRIWLDAGVREHGDAERLAYAGVERVVVGLETVHGPAVWQRIVSRCGSDRVVFSLDLFDGKPRTTAESWEAADGQQIVERVVALGGRQLIVLDLARVGVGHGVGTETLCAECVQRYPELAVNAGGGVRDRTDIEHLAKVGVKGVLLASALHDGTMTDPVVRSRA
jgi:phosphoribosylformimino-5-aminoimidazole carboxamide ribotide isomerase